MELRCKQCIIPQAVHSIKFDEQGYCALCNDNSKSNKIIENSAKNLQHRIDEIKQIGLGHDYDCLVGLSGGRDSAYLLHLLVKKHNLRCMAAYYKTPFTPNIIDDNVKMLTKKLGVPLIEMKISQKKHKAFAKKMMTFWSEEGDTLLASIACAPCKQVNQEIYNIAKNNDISYIVFGGNKLEHMPIAPGQPKNLKIEKLNDFSFWLKIKQMSIVTMRGISLLFKHPKLLLDLPILIKSSILQLHGHTLFNKIRYPNIKLIDYYFIAEYDEKAVIQFLSDVGWKIPENCNSTWRSDCSFNEIKNYIFKKNEGMNYVEGYLSNSIRAGILTQEEALKRVKVEGVISQDRIKEVCDILEIPIQSFQQ